MPQKIQVRSSLTPTICGKSTQDPDEPQYAYRAERSALDAVQAVHKLLNLARDRLARRFAVCANRWARPPTNVLGIWTKQRW